ncbi:MAG: DUF1015 family protein [Chitinivibrionales bacterium]|nr:DUF1015 family protein [Chitinivibrionales bacterium]MBD3394905.1 DUF1015 family protein [Chitinivibrionales bacterium]
MAEIQPFRGYRYRLDGPGRLERFVSPPYDMLDSAMIDSLCAVDPQNAVRIIQNPARPEDTANKDRHVRAGKLFDSWIANGTLLRDDRESFYVYRQRFTIDAGAGTETFTRTGLVCLVKLVDFAAGIVLPHENTLSGPKADRYELMETARANTGQIFGLVPDEGDLHGRIAALAGPAPLGTLVDAYGVTHELFRSDNPQSLAAVQAACADRTVLIADGHHRYETALKYARDTGRPEASFVMMTLVSMADPGLVIRPFHRLVKRCDASAGFRSARDLEPFFAVRDLGPSTPAHVRDFMEKNSDFEMLFVDANSGHSFGLTTADAGAAFLAEHAEGMSPEWNALTVSKINRLVVQGIMQQPPDGHVLHDVFDYVNDAVAAYDRAAAGDGYTGCFFIRPLDIATVKDIVSAGERMPQKSTNFYPKLYSGLVFHSLENR